jgi:hypothetical protein
MPAARFAQALRALHQAGVDFVVVGGVAAVLNGAPLNTFDLDIVPAQDPANIARLVGVLETLEAIYRMQPERRLKPTADRLSSAGHHNLVTRLGPLDVLGTVGRGLRYQDLLPISAAMTIAEGVQVRVLDLPSLIMLKEQLGGEKDAAVLPVLRRTLKEKQLPG